MRKHFLFCALLVSSVVALTAGAYAESDTPSSLIARALRENRAIVQIRGTATSDAQIEQLCVFFTGDERRQLNLTTARVVKVLNQGEHTFQPNQILTLSEAGQHTFSMLDHKHDTDAEKEPSFASSAMVGEDDEYIYVVDRVETVQKSSGTERATFTILTELDRKAIFRIVPDDKKSDLLPTITESEVRELHALASALQAQRSGLGGAIAATGQTTAFGKAVAQQVAAAQATPAVE